MRRLYNELANGGLLCLPIDICNDRLKFLADAYNSVNSQ
jgi:hypothetical protein